MLMHIAKLIWNRKRSNLLIISEVAITFGVLFTIINLGIYSYKTYNLPLGFEWKNSWNIQLETGGEWNNETDRVLLKSMVEILNSQPEIESANVLMMPQFENSRWSSSVESDGKIIAYHANRTDKDAFNAWGIKITAGRVFGPQDDEQAYTGVMVNQRFVENYIGEQPSIGFEFSDSDNPEVKPMRVVGVFEDFRQQGDLSKPMSYVFFRYNMEEGYRYGVRNIVVTFNQPQGAVFEKALLKTLKSVAPNWEFVIEPLKTKRASQIDQVAIPLKVLATVVAFLLIMVALGLFGVLWQNISRRTQEIGLRRAIGASEKSIQLQVIGELVVIALFGIILASIFIVQVPLLQLIESVTWSNFWLSLGAAFSIMLIVVVLCALYPSYSATKLSPADALHYE